MKDLKGLSEDQLRQEAQESAKRFKAGWIDLGRVLYSISKNKIFKFWGYLDFTAYTGKNSASKIRRLQSCCGLITF